MMIFAAIFLFALVAFASALIVTSSSRARAEASVIAAAEAKVILGRLEELTKEQEKLEKREGSFADLKLRAEGVAVYDTTTESFIFEENKDKIFPIASITKVMTILTAADYLSPNSLVYVDEEAINTEGESGLIWGEQWSFKELADLTMIVSSNDGSVAIAKAAGKVVAEKENRHLEDPVFLFVEKMNQKAKELGLRDTTFANPSGLDLNLETVPSALSTSAEISKLFSVAIEKEPALFSGSRLASKLVTSVSGRSFTTYNTNYAADELEGLIASKTGNTLQAGGTLVIAIEVNKRPVVITVLGSTIADRIKDIKTLHEATKLYFENL